MPHFQLVFGKNAINTCHHTSIVELAPIPGNMPPQTSPDRALQAILPLIASGQAYEAHQKARTFGSRYLKAHAYDTAIQVLFPSARELLKAGHAGSGSDLALFLIDVYVAKEQPVDATSRGEPFALMVDPFMREYQYRTRFSLSIHQRPSHSAYCLDRAGRCLEKNGDR